MCDSSVCSLYLSLSSLLFVFCSTARELQTNKKHRDFPGGPVVKTSPSSTGAVGSVIGRGAKTSRASSEFSSEFPPGISQKGTLEVESKISGPGTSLVADWLRFRASTAGGMVQSLVGELRSCKPDVPPPPKSQCLSFGCKAHSLYDLGRVTISIK